MGAGNLTQLANGGSGLVGREAEQALIAARLGHLDEGAARAAAPARPLDP